MAQVYIHFLVPDENGPIISRAPQSQIGSKGLTAETIVPGRDTTSVRWVQSRLKIACRPEASLEEARHASGERGAVTCPACLASQELLDQEYAAQSQSAIATLQPPTDCCN